MKLNVEKRVPEKKCDVKRLRRAGKIPGVLYQKGADSISITLDGGEFSTHMREMVPGHLPTSVFSLHFEEGQDRKAIVKEIQYNPVNYQVLHLDFEELKKGEKCRVKVPIVVIGEADSVGTKQGGTVRVLMRHVVVECPPEQIPTSFVVDVKEMQINESVRVQSLPVSNEVRLLTPGKEIAVSMVKK